MRCRNCGTLGHKTEVCPRYGPWYPEPGKTKEDYVKVAEKIANLVAKDIMAEHEGQEPQEEYVSARTAAARKKREEAKACLRGEHCTWQDAACAAALAVDDHSLCCFCGEKTE